ncbi:MAG: DUF6382 domain-containing protein [Vulcanibacillus sp.]
MNNLYNLEYEYLQQNGSSILFWSEKGLEVNQLNNIQVKMLLSNNIPNLLQLEVEESDFNIKLRYDISGKRTLSSYIKMQYLHLEEALKVFSNIVSIINDSRLYMLEEKNYIINQDFIFICADSEKLYFTYLPLKEIPDENSIQVELKKLFMYLFNDSVDIDTRLYQDIIKYLDNDYFNISSLKQLLFKFDLDSPKCNNSQLISSLSNEKPNNLVTKKVLKPLSERLKILIYSGEILLIAILWRLYLEKQNEGVFYISLGVTIIIIDITYVFMKLWRPKFKKTTKVINQKKYSSISGLEDKTTLLTLSDETALLKKNRKKIYLKIDRGTTLEEIEVDCKSFIIGRNPNTVNYVENSYGISRVHIEIIEDSTEYLVRDLGSKNGSYLNDKALIPNKIYPIKNGDIIKLAKTEFTIKEVHAV